MNQTTPTSPALEECWGGGSGLVYETRVETSLRARAAYMLLLGVIAQNFRRIKFLLCSISTKISLNLFSPTVRAIYSEVVGGAVESPSPLDLSLLYIRRSQQRWPVSPVKTCRVTKKITYKKYNSPKKFRPLGVAWERGWAR